MNILYDLTKHLIIASKNLKIEPKLAPHILIPSIPLSMGKTPQINLPRHSEEVFTQPLMIKQNVNLKPLESIAYGEPQIPRPRFMEVRETPIIIPTMAPAMPPAVPQVAPKPSFYLGNIQGFVQDPSINMIVCDGPMKPLKVKRQGRMEQTSLILNRAEIDYLVNTFSKASNLPLKPVFRSKIENLSLLALVSSMESRFMLTIDR